MARVNAVRVTRTQVEFASVVGRDVKAPRNHIAQMRRLAALASDNGLDALRPPPPRLKGQPRDRCWTKLHNAHTRLIGRTGLVRCVHALRLDAGHAALPGRCEGTYDPPAPDPHQDPIGVANAQPG